MIEIKNLTKKFGNTTILDDISLEVKKGEILGFLGPNGAGKSTTMKIITSFWTPTSGSVLIDGVNITQDTLVSRAKIGYLPETVPLYEDMRVYEYLKFIAEVRGIAKDKIRERIKEVVSDCGLSKVIRKPIEELSKGYRQRVGLAQAIMHKPDILILDEPTTGLDPNQITEIRDLIKKIGKEKTVIFSTHILGEVSATCDRVVIINNGKIVGEGNPNELAQKIGSKELIYVKIKGPKAEVETALRDLENVEKVESKDRESENIFGYEIEPKAGVDLREALSQTVMNKNWSILEFSKKSMSLEDVFRELTK
ncbi:MAG: ABC transporter related protein [Candidatus Falkowbacteria bacterium GW2011_GWC2_38_22]|uniref:ABC transporter related protein n=1 Tax=Candidatus Falkowbacteria bacterium GW2011_GWE1_38_31 TaxID=1618638 RepID=A0A0G0JUI9_9BACT|nr:MAG: ABC transporter related protein [Candidatus Falkowbacteria bacterium GW2011_GWF2_38_1205]KKQ61529.1 MAG: ABC transporter related protein [Candidatus Falkowbacteria bacterium GW2011_GWC2_38_22]KKQ63578.1 MAG: ABC transporter related protein [Candidatus Falkowbacteria bacterium GW2011_GWF1_38_22]KKQ65730.1 MAG: ABC transporter related protein [Candidatus Falkowbacteria bacterium GW2011_GWE2_38_254]KKQ70347.1 MAG: ABC transporter related protein [Candidatus Falkowbacteria bacterium GW2011_